MAGIVRKEQELYQKYITGMNVTEEGVMVIWALAGLSLLALLLLAGWYGIQNHTVRIYNWNGRQYCYLGRAGLYREDGGYSVKMKERMADLSYTTLYQICPARGFVRRNRYRNLMLCAGDERCMLHVDSCMRKSIYYRRRFKI